MYSLISHRGIYNESIKEYVVDTEQELFNDVPKDIPAGSTCFVIETSKTYMLNHKQEWNPIQVNNISDIL